MKYYLKTKAEYLTTMLDSTLTRLMQYTHTYSFSQLLLPFEYNGNLDRFKRVNSENPSVFENDNNTDEVCYVVAPDGDIIVWMKLPNHYSIEIDGVLTDRALNYCYKQEDLQPEFLTGCLMKFGKENISNNIENLINVN